MQGGLAKRTPPAPLISFHSSLTAGYASLIRPIDGARFLYGLMRRGSRQSGREGAASPRRRFAGEVEAFFESNAPLL